MLTFKNKIFNRLMFRIKTIIYKTTNKKNNILQKINQSKNQIKLK